MTRTLLSLFAALVLAAATLLGLAATTEPGLRWLFAAAARVLPGQLSAAEIHGTLLQPIRIDGLRYVRNGMRLEVKEIDLRWRPAALWQRTLDIEALHIRGLHVHYTPAARRTPAVALPRLALPLRVVLQDLRIDGASLQTPGAKQPFTITQLRLAAMLDAQRLAINRLRVESTQLSLSLSGGLQPRGDYPLDFKLRWQLRPGAPLPPLAGEGTIRGTLKHLTLAQQLSAPGEARVDLTIDRPLGALSWRAQAELSPLSARSLNPAWPPVQIGAKLQVSGNAEHFQGSADYDARGTPAGPVRGRLRLSGNRSGAIELQELSAETAGKTPMHLSLSGSGELRTRRFSLRGQWHDLAWPPNGEAAARSPAGELSAQGTPTAYTLKAKGSLALPRQAPLDWQLTGSGTAQELRISEAQIGVLGGALHSAGKLGWVDGLHFDLNGTWENLSWPSPQQPKLGSAQGGYTLQGRPDDYSLKLHGSLSGKDIPAGQWALAVKGDKRAAQINELRGQLLDGTVQGQGHIAWAAKPEWTLSVAASGLDPGKKWPEWPGRIGLQARTAGTIEAGKAEGSFELSRLEGKLRGYPVSGSARLTIAGPRYRIETLKLRSGRSALSATGEIGEQLALDWNVDSPDLRELLPGARGSVQASGKVRGARGAPDIKVSLTARGPAYAALSAASLKARLDVALAGDGRFSVDVDAAGLRYGARTLGHLVLQSTGKADAHRIEASLQGPGPALSLRAQGGLAQGVWSGRLESSSLAAKPYGEWRQVQPITLRLSRNAVAASRGCWSRGQARLCLGGDWARGGKWQAESALTALPTSWLGQWLALPAELSGTLEAHASASGSGDQVAQAQAQLTASAGRIVFIPQAGEEPATLQHGELEASLHADASATTAEFRVMLTAPAQSPVQASVRLPPLRLDRAYLRQAPLQGSVGATISDLRTVEAFVPDLAELHGAAHADLQFSGTLGSPRLRGDAGITGASAEVPRLGIALKAVSLQAQGDADRIKLNGSASSGSGKLELSGQIGLDAGKGWPVELNLKGERFEAANIPEAWVLASPDLKLTAAHHAIAVTGEVTIPEAKLRPRQVIAAVPVSSDVVIVSGGRPQAKLPRWQITSRVRVTLGEKVSLEAFGFSGRITGSVLVHDSPGKPTTGSGALTVQDGTYSAYGQKLQIDGGHVVFAGGPITDPGLDLRAVRKLTDVTAGVRVQGRVSAPQLTLYSEPAMSQDNILSYLILGQPVDQASSTQGQLLARAASSLALQGGNLLSKRIASTFGLSNVGIESNGSPQGASLVIGKYLSPRLYLSYGMGLFQTMNTVRMRYKLGKHWSVEAETGTQTGADVLYSRER